MSVILNQNHSLNFILEYLLYKKPSSFVRKSDGENIVLAYGILDSIPFHRYRKKLIHFNIPIWNIPFQLFLRSELMNAFSNATLLGISPIEHRHDYWENEEQILDYFSLKEKTHCDMNFHMGFIKKPYSSHLMNPIAEEIIQNRNIGVISHCKVENFLKQFNSKVVTRIEIPRRRAKFQFMTRKIYNSVLTEIQNSIHNTDIWLVAAGVYAKPFCEYIRLGGGIGIDIGSSMDTWLNEYQSRGHLRRLLSEHNRNS
ncbi:MAG: hypothetical protein QF380_06225 [Candidatus Marinimicrobia bacterium]|jgi:hypothetical protein|nr:hypothetical protein [Candidatus Neomarinimicrobiota bacterium]